jgi:anion-transporting  ArsA/GET3 family ATPase
VVPLTRDPPSEVFEALARRRLLIVSGKGGVGRTSVAALVGLALARTGRRVLVATTGHDDRLAWMMGAESLPAVPLQVAPGLSIQRLVPRVCLREYGALVLRSERISGAVFDNRVVRRLLRAIPGLDDFTVLGKVWHEAIRARSFDTIVFDGPASGHLRLNLGVPRTILRTVPGGPLRDEAELIQAALEDDSLVAALLVGLPERWPLTELTELGASLRDEVGLSVASVVINGTVASDLPPLGPTEGLQPELARVVDAVDAVTHRGRTQTEEVDAWLKSDGPRRCAAQSIVDFPWCADGLDGPRAFADLLDQLAARPEVA